MSKVKWLRITFQRSDQLPLEEDSRVPAPLPIADDLPTSYIAAYLLFLYALIFFLSEIHNIFDLSSSSWYGADILFFECAYIGALGGTVYCTIALWRHGLSAVTKKKKASTKKTTLWYIFRPIGSAATGLVSLLALKAGLIVVSTTGTDTQATDHTFIYLVIAFFAGYRMVKILEILEKVTPPFSSKEDDTPSTEESAAANESKKD